MAIRKNAATSDTTKINVAVLAEHLKSIDGNVSEVKDEVKGVKDQFVLLNGKVNSHASNLAVLNAYDLDNRVAKQETFSNKVIGGLIILGAINVVVLILNYSSKLLATP